METLTKFKSRKTAAVDARAGTGRPETEYLWFVDKTRHLRTSSLDLGNTETTFMTMNVIIDRPIGGL